MLKNLPGYDIKAYAYVLASLGDLILDAGLWKPYQTLDLWGFEFSPAPWATQKKVARLTMSWGKYD